MTRFCSGRLASTQGRWVHVLTADDGKGVLEASRNYSGIIDLLLSDVDMPRMGGLDLSQTIAAERPGIKVLLMSGDLWRREQVLDAWIAPPSKAVYRHSPTDSIEALLGPIPPLR